MDAPPILSFRLLPEKKERAAPGVRKKRAAARVCHCTVSACCRTRRDEVACPVRGTIRHRAAVRARRCLGHRRVLCDTFYMGIGFNQLTRRKLLPPPAAKRRLGGRCPEGAERGMSCSQLGCNRGPSQSPVCALVTAPPGGGAMAPLVFTFADVSRYARIFIRSIICRRYCFSTSGTRTSA